MNTKITNIFTVVLLSVLLCGCSVTIEEPIVSGPYPEQNGDKTELTINVTVPGVDSPYTRTLEENDEHHIKTLDVIAFKKVGANEVFQYVTHATDIKNISRTNKQFKAVVLKSQSNEEYRFVLVANLRKEIDAVKSQFAGKTKQALLPLIKFQSSTEWNASSSSNFTPLPMWGEAQSLHVINGSTVGNSISTIKMLRSVARVDVGVNMVKTGSEYTAQGFGDLFKISRIKIYNTNKEGFAAPISSSMNGTDKVKLPTVGGIVKNTEPLEYQLTPAALGLIRGIYVSEYDNLNAANEDDLTTLLIAGRYDGSGTDTWYKVRLYNKNLATSNTSYDLLRNFRYVVNIKSIEGPGYDTEARAIEFGTANMDVDVEFINDGDISSVVYDKNHMLGVDKREVSMGRKASTESIFVTTDYTYGWSAKISDSPTAISGTTPWLTISQDSGPVGKTTLNLTTIDYLGNTQRVAYLHLKAGNLTNVVKVIQNIYEAIRLEINPSDEHVFSSGHGVYPIEALNINVSWAPANKPVYIYLSPLVNGGIVTDGAYATELNGGTSTFTIKAKKMNPAQIAINSDYELMSRLDFMVLNDDGGTVMKSVVLRQKHTGLRVEVDGVFSLLGGTESIKVFTTSAWSATLEDNGTAIADLLAPKGGVGDIVNGERLSFQLKTGNEDYLKGTSYIRLRSTDDSFSDVLVPIVAFWGYPYSYKINNDARHLVARPFESVAMTRNEGVNYCKNLGNGWRLSTTIELQRMQSILASDLAARTLRGFKENEYFSISRDGLINWLGYDFVDMRNGIAGTTISSSEKRFIRCVRNQ